jgi:hypothetical protein
MLKVHLGHLEPRTLISGANRRAGLFGCPKSAAKCLAETSGKKALEGLKAFKLLEGLRPLRPLRALKDMKGSSRLQDS